MDLIINMLLRTLLMYFFVLIVLRLMGKREIGKLSIFDLVVSIMMAEIAVVVIEDTEIALSRAIIPILILMITQIIISYISLKSKKLREVFEGKPAMLITKGKINDKEMKKQRYTIDDLLTQLREKNISNVADVEFALLETSGKLSVFEKPGDMPTPLIADGRILSKNLLKINKDHKWLVEQLSKNGLENIKEIYFASIDKGGKFYIDLKDE